MFKKNVLTSKGLVTVSIRVYEFRRVAREKGLKVGRYIIIKGYYYRYSYLN